jgi:hypothetical protein
VGLHLGKSKSTRTPVHAVAELEFLALESGWHADGMTIGFARMLVSWLSFHAIGDNLAEHLAGPRDEIIGLRILRAYDHLVANHATELEAVMPRMRGVAEQAIAELRSLILASRPVVTTSRMREVFAVSRPGWITRDPRRQALITRWEQWWGPGEAEIGLSSIEARFQATLGTRREGLPAAGIPATTT